MKVIDGIPVFGEPIDEGALSQIKTCARSADYVALMADHHKGYSVPIGGVVAYRDKISPSGVGFDIACGNKAVRVDASASEVRSNISTIMDDIWNRISFGIGQKNNIKVDDELFDDGDPGWDISYVNSLKQMAHSQLGTVGSGNHYVDIFTDELDRVWIGVHFGSRGFGHKIASYFLKEAGAKDGMDVEPCILETNSEIGQSYLAAMSLAGRYAYAGRDWVVSEVARILGANILEEVHNHHNFAWREKHGDTELWVVRKGATPAFPGQRGFIGGSMGEDAVIVAGRASDDGKHTLYSTVHGAGRVMSRTAARGKTKKVSYIRCKSCSLSVPKFSMDTLPPVCSFCGGQTYFFKANEVVSKGAITQEMLNEWMERADVVLRGGGLDEAPQAYKRLPEVLAHHSDSISILHTLTPIGVAMAGENEFDPYKD